MKVFKILREQKLLNHIVFPQNIEYKYFVINRWIESEFDFDI